LRLEPAWLAECFLDAAMTLEWIAELILTLILMTLIIGCGLTFRRWL